MRSYIIEHSGTGEVFEAHFEDELEAIDWVKDAMEFFGYNPDELAHGDWDADGKNDDGEQCWRMLFWANEKDATNDSGVKSICQLCKVG